jgi:hypothetical protein
MHNTQFKEIPPLEDVKDFLLALTGLQSFHIGATWLKWNPVDPDDIYMFLPYIRKCHQKILMDTANGIQKNPCALLRQLLRPHGFCIENVKKHYTICEWKEEVKTVGKKKGKVVVWED